MVSVMFSDVGKARHCHHIIKQLTKTELRADGIMQVVTARLYHAHGKVLS